VSGATFNAVLTPEDATDALESSNDHVVVIYKHSPICDLSAMAMDEMQAFLQSADAKLDVRLIDVLAARPASQWVEVRTGVRHESPQVLVLSGGSVVWHASHRRITATALAQALVR
jgi:bacillithiol system protein YtxJ